MGDRDYISLVFIQLFLYILFFYTYSQNDERTNDDVSLYKIYTNDTRHRFSNLLLFIIQLCFCFPFFIFLVAFVLILYSIYHPPTTRQGLSSFSDGHSLNSNNFYIKQQINSLTVNTNKNIYTHIHSFIHSTHTQFSASGILNEPYHLTNNQ